MRLLTEPLPQTAPQIRLLTEPIPQTTPQIKLLTEPIPQTAPQIRLLTKPYPSKYQMNIMMNNVNPAFGRWIIAPRVLIDLHVLHA